MVKYILKRLVQLVVVLLGVTFLTFMITQAAPSDAAEMKYVSMGMMPSSELLEKTREEMGLNDPVLIQYGRWLGNVLHGDLGESSKFGESVLTQMTRKLPMTLKLAGVSLVVVILISFPLGVLSAVKKNKTADYIIRFLSFFGVSMPNFWLALLLMYIFAVRLGWFKVVSTDSIGGMILPVATLTIPMISSYARQIRAALLEELNANYVIVQEPEAYRSAGLSGGMCCRMPSFRSLHCLACQWDICWAVRRLLKRFFPGRVSATWLWKLSVSEIIR